VHTISQVPINFPILHIPMNRFNKHLMLAGFLFSLFSLPTFATNTGTTHPIMADSVRLYATRTTTTIPNVVNIDITVGSFVDINQYIFSIGWDPTKLQLLNVEHNYVAAFALGNIDITNAATGIVNFTWNGTPTTLVDGTQIFRLRFLAQTPSAIPIPINFIDNAPTYPRTFKNSLNETLPFAGSYGEVRIVSCNSITPSLRCNTATLLCAKDMPICGRLPTSNVQDNPGNQISCGNIQNNIWLAFIAGSDSLKLKIKVSNCNRGNGSGDGIQISVLETNDCASYSRLACNAGIRDGEEALLEIPEGGNLTIGKQYYIMIDGVNADVCDFQIDVIAGVIGSTMTTVPAIGGASTACANQSNIPFSIPAQTGAMGYIWKIAGNSATISSGNNTPSVNVNWGTVADSVCVQVIGRCDTSARRCKFVDIGIRSVRDITAEKCATNTYRFNNQNLLNPGNYSATYTSSTGCDSVVNLTLVNYPAATRTIDSTVCIGSSVRIGTKNYSVAGTFKDTLFGASYRGCDSIVTLNLKVIESNLNLAPQNAVLTCQLPIVGLTAYYTNPSNASATFEWMNSAGQSLVLVQL
jgi:PKD-like domain